MVHSATLLSSFIPKEDEALPNNVIATMAVVKACSANNIRRLVVKSDISACNFLAETDMPADKTFNETHWSNPEVMGYHAKSITLAEKAAWDFQAALPDGEGKFELTTILPGKIGGPPLFSESFGGLSSYCDRILTGKVVHERSSHAVGFVDVRDCALMQKKAIEVPEAAGRRFISVGSSPKYHEIDRPVIEKYGPLGWPVPSV